MRERRKFAKNSTDDAIDFFDLLLPRRSLTSFREKKNKKTQKTISAEDVANALADSGFEELAAPLREEAEAKRVAAKEAAAGKKRDRAEAAAAAEAEAVPAAAI